MHTRSDCGFRKNKNLKIRAAGAAQILPGMNATRVLAQAKQATPKFVLPARQMLPWMNARDYLNAKPDPLKDSCIRPGLSTDLDPARDWPKCKTRSHSKFVHPARLRWDRYMRVTGPNQKKSLSQIPGAQPQVRPWINAPLVTGPNRKARTGLYFVHPGAAQMLPG
jgi:hypothetical protein